MPRLLCGHSRKEHEEDNRIYPESIERRSGSRADGTRDGRPVHGNEEVVLVAGHFSAVRRSFESRAMPETEKPPAKLVDTYFY